MVLFFMVGGALLEVELLVSTVSFPNPKPTPAQIAISIARYPGSDIHTE